MRNVLDEEQKKELLLLGDLCMIETNEMRPPVDFADVHIDEDVELIWEPILYA